MSFSVDVHPPLKYCIHLIRENEIVGVHDNIPGVVKELTSDKGRDIAPFCVSSRFIFTNLEEPQLEPELTVNVVQLRLSVTKRFETELIAALDANRRLEFSRTMTCYNTYPILDMSSPDQLSCVILERKISVGIHNGKCYVGAPFIETFHEEDGYFIHEDIITLKRYVNNPCYCILFQVECTGIDLTVNCVLTTHS
jgi:hypothetical protein